MMILRIFDLDGNALATIRTTSPGRSAHTWLRDNNHPGATWYAPRIAS